MHSKVATRFRGSTLSRSFVISVALAVLTLLAPAGALARGHSTPTPAPTATPSPPPEDPKITIIARREFVDWQAGVVDKSHYAPETQAKLSPDKVADTSKALSELGALKQIEWYGPLGIADGPPGVKGYLYHMICANASVYEELTIGPDGLIDGIVFRDKLS
jgi:hypothetical protein